MGLTSIRNADGERLDFRLHGESHETVVIIGHGVTANKDREWALTLAAALADHGLAALRFSFAGNGSSEGSFEASCPTKEVGDLAAVRAAVERLGSKSVFYVGHSMGAAVGVMAAADWPGLVGLVSLGGMVHTGAFCERKFGDQIPGDSLMWDKPECPLSQAFVDDMAGIESVLPTALGLKLPWLLVHGTKDTVVPMAESEEIARALPNATLMPLEGADHVFSGSASYAMAKLVTTWIASTVGAQS